MKKILCTGMNKQQCNKDFYKRMQLKVVPSHYSLIRCLEDMGYEVEQREVVLGEDLSEYDDVIVYIHTVQAFCNFLWSGLYAISARPDCIIAFDDWQYDQIYGSIVSYKDNLENDLDSAFREYLVQNWEGKEPIEEVKKYTDNFKRACDIVIANKNRLLVSAFDGGDLSLLKLRDDTSSVFRFNPNPYHLNRTPENNFGLEKIDTVFSLFGDDEEEKKAKRWNFASLVHPKTRKWLDKQNPDKWTWDIEYFGGRQGKFKSERKTEGEMVKKFSEQWGCLMPGYFHAGSGWWRARYLQVADVGSILVGDTKELMVVYNNEEASNKKVIEIESMTDVQLKDFAAFQKECLYKTHPLDKEVQRDELSKILLYVK